MKGHGSHLLNLSSEDRRSSNEAPSSDIPELDVTLAGAGFGLLVQGDPAPEIERASLALPSKGRGAVSDRVGLVDRGDRVGRPK
jgi:hypothetical protein